MHTDGQESGAPDRLPPPSAASYQRLREAMAREPSPVRASWAEWLRRFLPLPLMALSVLVADALLRARSVWRFEDGTVGRVRALAAALAFAFAVLVTSRACAHGRDGLGPRLATLRALAFAGLPASLLPVAALLATRAAYDGEATLHPLGMPCALVASVIAAVALALLFGQLRGRVAVAVEWRGAALASAATCWAATALLFHCPSLSATHLFSGHVLPLLAFPLAGLALSRRYLSL